MRSAVQLLGILLRLAQDLRHRADERIERLLALGLGGLDQQTLADQQREIRRGRMEAQVEQPLGHVHRRHAVLLLQPA
jgi:hypothetical protein